MIAGVVLTCAAAPLWAAHVARTTPTANHLAESVEIDGRRVDVVGLDGTPIGPTWRPRFFLGADANGRDTMVRLLYGGRTSLAIGGSAALLTLALGLVLGLVAGYFRGWVDAVVAAALDVLWSFPVILLGVALGVALALGGLRLGPVAVEGGSKAIPILVIALVYVPYLARPVRNRVLELREQAFVEAARAQGAGALRIMAAEILPNLRPTLAALAPLLVANAILLEGALSFLGAGVRPPDPSWGAMIGEGVELLVSAEHLALAPGAALVVTVLALQVLAGGLRDPLGDRGEVLAP